MAPRAGLQQQGLTILELTLILLMIAVLIVVALERMIQLRVDIERAAVEHNVGAMRSALSLKFAELVADGRIDRLQQWAGGNALELVRGEPLAGGSDPEPGPGNWYYDAQADEIVYAPAHPEALTGDPAAEGRWRVVVVGDDAPAGLKLETVEPLLTSETD